MSISLTKRNFLYQITLLTLIAGWVGAGILHYLLPGHYFGGYPFIPVYFFLFGLFEISMFDACRKHAPQDVAALHGDEGDEDVALCDTLGGVLLCSAGRS